MHRIRSKITYANLVATLALFIALGGVSYAAVKLPANSVGEKQIKKNAVTTKKIKKNAITGDKIKPGTIKGTDIAIDTLGKVPAAANADSAGNSNTTNEVVTVSKRVVATVTGPGSQDATRAAAPEIPLVSNGQVSVYGKCYLYSGAVYAELLSKTNADGALINSYTYNYYYGSNGYLNTSTTEDQRRIYYTTAGSNSGQYLGSPYYGAGHIYGPNGGSLGYNLTAWAKQGLIPTYGNGAYGDGSVCIFAGNAMIAPAD